MLPEPVVPCVLPVTVKPIGVAPLLVICEPIVNEPLAFVSN